MNFIKELLQIKRKQLCLEEQRSVDIKLMRYDIHSILELMKGGVKDGKHKNKRNR